MNMRLDTSLPGLPAFQDTSLLKRALTHRSYVNENFELGLEDNERLEFLGDAVLDFASAVWLYNRFPEASEGRLTRLRAALVKTEMLAEFAAQVNLAEHIMVGKGERESGGQKRINLLADAFEAVVGALYLDQGMEAVQRLIEPLFALATEHVVLADLERDAKSTLQEWSQAERGQTPRYRTVSASGPDHAKVFAVEVCIGSQAVGRGEGSSKQVATQAAAADAIRRLQVIWPSRTLEQDSAR
ncbi:MAG: ribonuclease III [Thermoflexales bacterium]|nr:ribonuclease III [Thermoflexales bacterium]